MIEPKIHYIRGQKVMLDSDLAELYQVGTKRLNEAVKRNRNRFPEDFMFQLTAREVASLKSQTATSKERRGGRRTLPYAFTEHGVAMLSSVLGSECAVRMNIAIIRAFIKMRESLSAHADLAHRLEDLERKYDQLDGELKAVFGAIRMLITPPDSRAAELGSLAAQLRLHSAMDTLGRIYEEFKVQAGDLVEKVRQLIHEGNVRRIIIKDKNGATFMEIPLTVATLGVIAAPVLAAVGAIAAALSDFKVVVERSSPMAAGSSAGAASNQPGSNIGATEEQVDMKGTVGQRIDSRGTKVEDLAGTGEQDSPGG